ncbi:MAG: hypothetical protein M0Q91_16380 [Methanoregula sp.]|jgi:hypothetical protein|nr:hypothetical protein [Methanoregula sp.]
MKKKIVKNTVKNKVRNPEQTPVTKITIDARTALPFIDALLSCNKEHYLNIEQNKICVRSVDTGNVFILLAECECITEIPERAPKRAALDFNLIKKILTHSKDCRITISIDGEKASVDYGRFSAKVPLVDPEFMRKEPNPPTINLDTNFDIPGKYLYDVCRMISKNGKIRISAENGVAFATAEDGDLIIKEVVGTCNKSSHAMSLFSNDYLTDIAKCVKTSQISIDVAIDHPVKISSEQNGCKLMFLLAPRIEAD